MAEEWEESLLDLLFADFSSNEHPEEAFGGNLESLPTLFHPPDANELPPLPFVHADNTFLSAYDGSSSQPPNPIFDDNNNAPLTEPFANQYLSSIPNNDVVPEFSAEYSNLLSDPLFQPGFEHIYPSFPREAEPQGDFYDPSAEGYLQDVLLPEGDGTAVLGTALPNAVPPIVNAPFTSLIPPPTFPVEISDSDPYGDTAVISYGFNTDAQYTTPYTMNIASTSALQVDVSDEHQIQGSDTVLDQFDAPTLPPPQTSSTIMRGMIGSDALFQASEQRRIHPPKFTCLVEGCHRGFTSRPNAERHIFAHFCIKPHLCPCGAAFTSKSDLRRHFRNAEHTPTDASTLESHRLYSHYARRYSKYLG